MEEAKQSSIMKVLMLPWLAHGHISPFLELAKRLAVRSFHIYICSTPVNLTPLKKKIAGKYSGDIGLVELHLPYSPELPPHYHTTNGLPPHLVNRLKKAYELSTPEFSSILGSLRPDLVIYDFNQPWAADIASSQDIPAVQFLPVGAAFVSFGLHMTKNYGNSFPYPEIYLRDYERIRNQGQDQAQITNTNDRDVVLRALDRSHKIVLIKSCREIEGKFIDLLSVTSGKKFVPVGPIVESFTDYDEEDRGEDQEIIEWLDQKEKDSVVYVSFGSEYFLNNEEREVISKGLELSNVDFVWVLRFPMGEEISIGEALPEGFLDRSGNRGKILEGWAPQAKILKHSSVGAFVSHCGWSSAMESIVWGVPIVAMPIQIDQPFNARMLEAVGVGVEAVRDDGGNLRSEEIAKAIRKVLVEESGGEVRKKAKELSKILEMKGDEEIDTLQEELLGVCGKK